MRLFAAITLIATVASAAYIRPTVVSGEAAEIQEIIAAIQSPSTDPATAAALEQMLLEAMGVKPEPISVGPAIIDFEHIAVGPAIVDNKPISVGPALVDFPTAPSPGISDVPRSRPLVQIIVNTNQAVAEAAVVSEAIHPESDHAVNIVEVEPTCVIEIGPSEPGPDQIIHLPPSEQGPGQIINVPPSNPIDCGSPSPPDSEETVVVVS